ncbi:glycosyltransferase family 4 protein [Bradyrhizobium liaoningense]|uniref:glycosyltransferase family 4 protein n=1 Tax=Bradyrhizobium liaoningense TaxID=43992 RepID=UPI001BA5A85B|nr:glycosyltransferase family 4 protein [Bradyrhizobium liaoningense]MBR0903884.1 glycosyltransferase family 4 protein [Bradyrhizobium liaoningense]
MAHTIIPKQALLLSAFACDPMTGSEPYVGWNWAKMLASDFDVHVLTRRYSKSLIENDCFAERVTFHYFDLPWVSDRNHHWRFIKLYYLVWQILVLPFVLYLHFRNRYIIVHHITYNNIDVPGFLWLCPFTSFVWGPVGGGQVAPHSLREVYGSSWWKERLRSLLKCGAQYNPVVLCAAWRARLVFFANEETAGRLKINPRKSILLLETAIDGAPHCALTDDNKESSTEVRILWLSHVFRRKGLGLAIEAFRMAADRCSSDITLRLDIVGDGPALAAEQSKAKLQPRTSQIYFHGAIPHDQVQEYMATADIFLFSSVQDTSGNVLLEAMRNALPIVALDHQGARAILAKRGGKLVSIGTYRQTVASMSQALVELAIDANERAHLGREAREEVLENHTWSSKRARVLEAYGRILAG